MISYSTNENFLAVVRRASRSLGRDASPSQSVAIFPQQAGKYLLRLIDTSSGDPRDITIKKGEVAASRDDVPRVIAELLGKNDGTEICCLYQVLGDECGRKWTWVNPILLEPMRINGQPVEERFVKLITD